MLRFLMLFLMISSVAFADPKKPEWSEYEARFDVFEGRQPVVTIRWWTMEANGSYQEYPQIWRKGMKFGYGKRLQVEELTGVDFDGNKKEGQVVTAVILDTKTNMKFTFTSDGKAFYRSYSDEWMQEHSRKFPPAKDSVSLP